MEDGKDKFGKIERILLRVALIILLAVGLLKVVAPEVRSLGEYFSGRHESSLGGH